MIDISPFCVRFDLIGDQTLRMVLYVAPGFGGFLAQQLRRFGARKKNSRSCVIAVPAQIAAVVRELGLPEGLVALMDDYKAAWVGCRHGVKVDTARIDARKKAVAAIVAFDNGLYVSAVRSD